jgi:signal transduction histidine kinase
MKKKTLSWSIQLYQRLIEISRDLASTLDLDTLLRRIIQVAEEFSQAEAASILLYDENKKQLYFQAASNPSDEALMHGMVVPTKSIAGWVALNRKPLIVADVGKDPRHFDQVANTLNFKTDSILAVPMIAKDRLVGVLEVLNKKDGPFTKADEEPLLLLGSQAAIAIENSRTFQQSDLISELVHELRTPLSSISTIAYLLQRQDLTEDNRLNLIQIIQRETLRLDEMATSFLDLARLESGRALYHISTFHLSPLLEEIYAIVEPKASEKGIVFSQELPSELPALQADRDKIKQVLLNLYSNAIKYNQPNGQVIFKAWADEQNFWMAIQDTGFGIPENDMPHLFEKFFRVQATEKLSSGTGLGLSICKRIVEIHGGKITVQSTPDVGTTFTIQMPLCSELAPR